MKRVIAILSIVGALGLTACENMSRNERNAAVGAGVGAAGGAVVGGLTGGDPLLGGLIGGAAGAAAGALSDDIRGRVD